MPTRIETNYSWETTGLNDGGKLQKRCQCPHDWGWSIPENPIKEDDLCASRVWIKNLLPRTNKNAKIIEKVFGDQHGISRVWTQFVGSTINQQLSWRTKSDSPAFSRKKLINHLCGTHAIMCCSLNSKNAYRWLSQQSSWLYLQIIIGSQRENQAQNPWRCTKKVHWVTKSSPDSSLHSWMVKIRLKSKPWKRRRNLGKGKRMGSTRENILSEHEYQRIHKDWRKHYVVLQKRNQGKCTHTSRTRCWYSLEKF